MGFYEAPANLSNYLQGVNPPLTLAQLAAQVAGPDVRQIFFGSFVPATLAYTQNVVPASYAGLAGLSRPVGLTGAGLPAGMELDGLEGRDETILGIGLSVEKALARLPPPSL